MAHLSLEDRFKKFLGQLENSESIDESISNEDLSNGKRADFLLDGRRIVVEIKSLENDPKYKVDERLAPHRNRPEFPQFYWEADLNEILPYLPDGQDVRREISHAVLRSVQGALEKADDQIGATKNALGLKNSCGVVVILNERIDILAPEIVTAKASQMLLKKKNGGFRYTDIAYVWIISESHRLAIPGKTEHLPLILLEGPSADNYAQAGTYIDKLQQRWATFEKILFSSLGQRKDFDGLSFKSRIGEPTESEKAPLTRQEFWRGYYRSNPYLRSCSEEDFIQYTVRILNAMTPHFLIGGKKLPEAKIGALMELWGHVLVEAEYRRLDMRKIQSRLPDLDSFLGGES